MYLKIELFTVYRGSVYWKVCIRMLNKIILTNSWKCSLVCHVIVSCHFSNNCIYCRYQFNPARFHTRTAAKILLKSLMNLPETHFLLCTSLIDHKFVSINSVHSCVCQISTPKFAVTIHTSLYHIM